jgi:hypothetical protein
METCEDPCYLERRSSAVKYRREKECLHPFGKKEGPQAINIGDYWYYISSGGEEVGAELEKDADMEITRKWCSFTMQYYHGKENHLKIP